MKKGDLYPIATAEDFLGHLRGGYPYRSNYLFWPHYACLCNYHYASNAYDFARKYLTLGIGELVIKNPRARTFLKDLMSAVRRHGEKDDTAKPVKDDVRKLVDDFFKYGYIDDSENPNENVEFEFKEGGLGIIHTTINLGETPNRQS